MTLNQQDKLACHRTGAADPGRSADAESTAGLEALVIEHQKLKQALDELSDNRGSPWEKKADIRRVRRLICEHDSAEVSILAPVIRCRLEHGHALWKSSQRLYRQIDSLLARIDRRSISSPDLPELFGNLNAILNDLIGRQETLTFPQLRSALSEEQLEDLGDQLERAHRHATSRPHPYLRYLGPFGNLTRSEMAALDKLRDRTPPRL